MKKILAITATLIAITSIASAIELTPGTTTELTNQTENYTSATSTLSLTFTENQSGIYANTPSTYPPTNGTITLNYENDTKTFAASVKSLSNWTVEKNSEKSEIPVGESGDFTEYNLTQNGNVDKELTVSAEGNLSKHLVYKKNVVARKGIEKTLPIDYQVPKDTAFGYYTANLTLKTESQTETLNLSTQIKDGIKPQLINVSLPSFMATNTPEAKITATDNLNVSKVNATIHKYNSTSKSFDPFVEDIQFSNKKNTDEWLYELTQTSKRDRYRLNFNITDSSGNSIGGTHFYNISRLNVTQIVNDNFRFDPVWPNGEKTQPLLVNDQEVDAEINLSSFDEPDDVELELGILKPGDAEPVEIEEGESIQINEKGKYSLSVEVVSDSHNDTRDYSGVLKLELPTEHVDREEIRFGGAVQTDVYPKPRNLSIGQFRGRLTYIDSANVSLIEDLISDIAGSEEGLAIYVGATNREQCQGSTEWRSEEGCTEFDIGELNDTKTEIENIEDENQKLKNGRITHWAALAFVSVFTLFVFPYFGLQLYYYTKNNFIWSVWRTKEQKR